MFCRSCGNKLADNAKFCNLCGAAVPLDKIQEQILNRQPDTAPQPEPAPQPEAAPVYQPEPAPQQVQQPYQPAGQPYQPAGQQVQYQQPYQPYQPNYQQPQIQPYPTQQPLSAPYLSEKNTAGRRVLAGCVLAVCIFLVFTTLFDVYGAGKHTGAAGGFSNGVYTYLKRIGTAAKLVDKDIFTYSAEIVKNDASSGTIVIGFWLHALFEIAALVFAAFAVFRMFYKNPEGEFRLWRDIRTSALFSLLGHLCSLGVIIGNDVYFGLKLYDKPFKWDVVPNFWEYLFVSLALIAAIISRVQKKKLKRQLRAAQASAPAPVPMQVPSMQQYDPNRPQ